MYIINISFLLRGVKGNDGRFVGSVLEKTNVDTLENLSANFLHRFITSILNHDVNCDRIPVMVKLFK